METVLLASAVNQAQAAGVWGRKESPGGPALGLLGLLLWEGGRKAGGGHLGTGHKRTRSSGLSRPSRAAAASVGRAP